MSNESRMMFASIAEDHARSDHEALADTAMSVTEQLEAANQRELELLAVIKRMRVALENLSKLQRGDITAPLSSEVFAQVDASLGEIEPPQAFREHEANVLVDYISALRKQPSIGLSERQFGELKRVAEERMKK